MSLLNPFDPTFGGFPPALEGREALLAAYEKGLTNRRGVGFHLLLKGPRGSGKTVALGALADTAGGLGWYTMDETPVNDLGFSVVERLARKLAVVEQDPARYQRTYKAKGPGVEVEWAAVDAPKRTFRDRLARSAAAVVEQGGSGIVISVDELQSMNRDDASVIGNGVQHAVREELPVSMIAAALPNIDTVIRNNRSGFSFFERATPAKMENLTRTQALRAITAPLTAAGIKHDRADLVSAANATNGYPFAVQALGWHLWDKADGGTITPEVVEAAAAASDLLVVDAVAAVMVRDLTDMQARFAGVIAANGGPTAVAAIGEELGKPGNYIGVYRDQLVKAGVIFGSAHGEVAFTIPEIGPLVLERLTEIED